MARSTLENVTGPSVPFTRATIASAILFESFSRCMVAFIVLSDFVNAETKAPQRVSSYFFTEAVMAFFGEKLFLADRRTQNREKSKRPRRRGERILGRDHRSVGTPSKCDDFKVGGEHGRWCGQVGSLQRSGEGRGEKPYYLATLLAVN